MAAATARESTVPVLVVGAGPVGLSLAVELAYGVHGHLGAVADTLYLIRPDGYLGFRGEPPDGARLAAYFAGIVAG